MLSRSATFHTRNPQAPRDVVCTKWDLPGAHLCSGDHIGPETRKMSSKDFCWAKSTERTKKPAGETVRWNNTAYLTIFPSCGQAEPSSPGLLHPSAAPTGDRCLSLCSHPGSCGCQKLLVVTTLFKVSASCEIVFKALGMLYLPHKHKHDAMVQILWGQNYSAKIKLGGYAQEEYQSLKTSTCKTQFFKFGKISKCSKWGCLYKPKAVPFMLVCQDTSLHLREYIVFFLSYNSLPPPVQTKDNREMQNKTIWIMPVLQKIFHFR